ncbi:hypothetical protein [Methanocella conradii]|uniref:hypothetical protein n=1 Tax=Methanocella conradii TaxID=1175444 RepID=UPI0020C72E0B|nr:hypothetical protein [Methanocella conradii]
MREVLNVNAESSKDKAIYEHIADYIIQTLIREDVNAFAEAKLLSELLSYKLPGVAGRLMYTTASDASEKLKRGEKFNLEKEIGGITAQKRLHFRSRDQYNAFVMLFFKVVEKYPELLEPVDGEDEFERFMIHCINEFRQKLEGFAMEVAKERTELEYKNKLYIHRRNAAVPEVPTYADYIAERIDGLAE